MKSMPWQDIYPAVNWRQFIADYQNRQITSRSTNVGDRIHRRRHIDDSRIDHTLNQLTRDINNYHGVEKRSIDNLPIRANMLRGIAHTGQGFLNRYRISRKGTAGAAQKGTLDYAVTKLVRRAERKAEYCFELFDHVISREKGNRAGSKESLLEYLNRDKVHPGDLAGLKKDVRLEKLDPWHRPFEAKVHNGPVTDFNPEHLFNAIFQYWVWDTTDLPLFVWMEGHYVCKGVFADDQWGRYTREAVEEGQLGLPKGGGQVSYGADQTLHLIQTRGDKLNRWSPGSSDMTPLHTIAAPGKPGDPYSAGMYAFVWDRCGQLYAAKHAGGYFHHSSFTSGKKVKCAGMIKVDNGKVQGVNNNSGHYKPPTRNLKDFVAFLRDRNLFAGEAVIRDYCNVIEHGYTVREFMMQRPSQPKPPVRQAHLHR